MVGMNIRKKERIRKSRTTCPLCGVSMKRGKKSRTRPTIEHIIPRSEGGVNAYINLTVTCFLCNCQRKSKEWPCEYERGLIMAAHRDRSENNLYVNKLQQWKEE